MIPIIKNKKYIAYDEKPVYAADYRAAQDSLKLPQVLTIMMQGPLKLEENFTLETLKIYQEIFPNCPIVLSIWETENTDEVQKIKDLGVNVLLNNPSVPKGLWNINYQILSTQNGLAYAKKLGAKYVIKTRTDQRFYETNIPEFLFNLLKVFPPYNDKKQKTRLITLSMNTFKYRLYDISDMFLFGHIDDVIKFWSCDFEKRTEFPECKNMMEFSRGRPSEIYFTTEYLKKIGHKCEWTLQDSWLIYARYFCAIDANSVGLYWPKYSNHVYRWRNFFGANPELEELTFKEWLNIYVDLENKKDIPEHLLLDGWEQRATLRYEEDMFSPKQKINWRHKISNFIFYMGINSKGYWIIKILGIRILKLRMRKHISK